MQFGPRLSVEELGIPIVRNHEEHWAKTLVLAEAVTWVILGK